MPAFVGIIAKSVGRGRFHACPSSADPTKGGYETRPYKALCYDSGTSANFETISYWLDAEIDVS